MKTIAVIGGGITGATTAYALAQRGYTVTVIIGPTRLRPRAWRLPREHLFGWAADEQIDFDVKREGILHIYRDKGSFQHAAGVSRLLAEGGLQRRAVTPEEMRAIEPTLAGAY